jgi:hypothetical protein
MKRKNNDAVPFFLLCFLIAITFSCKPLIATYDQYAYTQATSLKVDMQNLIKKSATVKYSDASSEITNVTTGIQKAYEYAKGRSKNSLSTTQYAVLLSDNDFYKKFLADWSSSQGGMLSQTAADEMSKKAGDLMDTIIELESDKNKSH